MDNSNYLDKVGAIADNKWHMAYSLPPEEKESAPESEKQIGQEGGREPEQVFPQMQPGRNLGQLIEFDGFSDEEIIEMQKNAGTMENLFSQTQRICSVDIAYRQFFSFLCSVVERKNSLQQEVLERNLDSYISQFDMYKNHWEKYIKTFLKDKKLEDCFVRETHNSFDLNDGFALACCIRDFMTHSNSVIDRVGQSFDGLNITMRRDRLLKDLNWSHAKQNLIKAQKEELDLVWIVTESYKELLRINEVLLDAMLDDRIVKCCDSLVKNYITISEKGIRSNSWILFCLTGTHPVSLPTGFAGGLSRDPVETDALEMNFLILRWGFYTQIYERCKQLRLS